MTHTITNLHGARLLPVDRLKTDTTYQRPLSERKVKNLTKSFDCNKAGAILVSHRNGVYSIMDGQHRVAAARRCGVTHLPCVVYEGLSVREEAELRLAFGIRKPDTGADVFLLRLAMGDPVAHRIKRTIEDAGLTLQLSTTHGDKTGPRIIRAIGIMERIYTNYANGEALLSRTLGISMQAWPQDYVGRSGRVLDGVAAFLSKYPEVTDEALILKLQYITPASLLARAKDEWLGVLGIGPSGAIARLIWRAYNFKKRIKLPNRFGEGAQ